LKREEFRVIGSFSFLKKNLRFLNKIIGDVMKKVKEWVLIEELMH
jgi:hypothetical protein